MQQAHFKGIPPMAIPERTWTSARTLQRAAMTPSGSDWLRPWIQHHFNTLLLLVSEGAVGFGGLIQTESVSDYKRGIDIPLLNMLEQFFGVIVHMGLTHLEDQTLAEGRAERNLVKKTAVNSRNRNHAAL